MFGCYFQSWRFVRFSDFVRQLFLAFFDFLLFVLLEDSQRALLLQVFGFDQLFNFRKPCLFLSPGLVLLRRSRKELLGLFLIDPILSFSHASVGARSQLFGSMREVINFKMQMGSLEFETTQTLLGGLRQRRPFGEHLAELGFIHECKNYVKSFTFYEI